MAIPMISIAIIPVIRIAIILMTGNISSANESLS